jgi:hypothetical protein
MDHIDWISETPSFEAIAAKNSPSAFQILGEVMGKAILSIA